MSNCLQINFKPTGQLNSILKPIGLTIMRKQDFFFFIPSYDAYYLSDNQSKLSVDSSGIVLVVPIDVVPSAELILKLAKSLSLKVSDVHYSHIKFISGNTQPEPHHPSFDEEVSVLNGLFPHLKAQVSHDSFADRYLAYEAPHPVSGSSGSPSQIALNGPIDRLPAFKPIQKRAKSLLEAWSDYFPRRKSIYGKTQPEPHHPSFDEEVSVLNGLFPHLKAQVSHDSFADRYLAYDGMEAPHPVSGSLLEACSDYFSRLKSIYGKTKPKPHHPSFYEEFTYIVDEEFPCPVIGSVSAGFIVNWNVTCADNGAFRNTGIPNVGMNNGYGGNRSRVRGINAGQNGHPMYNGNGNGGGNVPNGGSDMLPGDDFGNYISINRRLNEGNGVPSFTPVGHIVLLNGDGFCSLTHKVHCQWARYENKTPFEDGEVDAFTAWPGYRIRYMGTVEGYELDGMVELEVPGWSWEVFADRLEEIIVERVDEEA